MECVHKIKEEVHDYIYRLDRVVYIYTLSDGL